LGRIFVLKEVAQRLASRLTAGQPVQRQALGRTLRRLVEQPLPGPQDMETLLPPGSSRCWVRRVEGGNLWVLFEFDETRVFVRAVSPNPPVPAEDLPPSDPEPGAAG